MRFTDYAIFLKICSNAFREKAFFLTIKLYSLIVFILLDIFLAKKAFSFPAPPLSGVLY